MTALLKYTLSGVSKHIYSTCICKLVDQMKLKYQIAAGVALAVSRLVTLRTRGYFLTHKSLSSPTYVNLEAAIATGERLAFRERVQPMQFASERILHLPSDDVIVEGITHLKMIFPVKSLLDFHLTDSKAFRKGWTIKAE